MFRIYLNLLEALKIVKKSTSVNDITDDNIIGKFQNKDVIKTNHLYDIRKGDTTSRSDNISNAEFIDILKRLPLDKKLQNKYYSVTFKNSLGKYDNIVFHVDETTIRFVTVIQQNRNKPNYKSKSDDITMIVETLLKEVEFILID